jgi:hypothetical protein
METSYFGIFANGLTVEKLTFDELKGVDDIIYKLKCTRNATWSNPPTFTILDDDGNNDQLTIGDFKVINIGEQSPGTTGGDKIITIKELRTGTVIQTRVKGYGISFFNDLLQLLNELNEVGSWKMYEKLKELDVANRKIAALQTTINELEATIKSLNSSNQLPV